VKNYLIYSTIFSVFSEALLINYVIDFKLFYLIIFVNLFLLCIYYPIKFSKSAIVILGLILSFGLLSIALGTNNFSRLTSQFVGITIIAFYYYNFFKNVGKSVEDYFELYSNFAFGVSGIGIIIFIFNLVVNRDIVPVKSFMLEPAHYCTAVLPACYFWFKHREVKGGLLKFFVILISIILSFSSLGILGIMLGVFLIPRKLNFTRLILPLLLGIVSFTLLLNFVPSFSIRVKDTVDSYRSRDLSEANLSSYALISNLFVASESFKNNPLTGGGLGSHVITHQIVISSIIGTENFGDMIDLNAQDANSLFIRVLSELGLFGVFLVFGFLFKFYCKDQESQIISRAILIYFFCKLLREGHYFPPEMYFFVLLYAFNKHNHFRSMKGGIIGD